MNLRRQMMERLARARHRADSMVNATLSRARGASRQVLNRFGGFSEPEQNALSQFVRPDFGGASLPARTVLEPVVALSALVGLAASLGLGLVSFVGMLLAGWIIYAILTYVFGLELDIAMPGL